MEHSYPFGAIETIDAVNDLYGSTLYEVLGLGSQSQIIELNNISKVFKTDISEFDVINHDGGRSYLGDLNIGKHHNSHYLFHALEDAEAYLKFAKENTAEPAHDPWYDEWCDEHFYDYDYPDEDN